MDSEIFLQESREKIFSLKSGESARESALRWGGGEGGGSGERSGYYTRVGHNTSLYGV
jgi:hypothetical protein